MKRSNFYLPFLLAAALVGCQDPTKESGTGGGNSTTGNTTISDSTYNNSGDFLENWDAYANGEMKVITITYSVSSVSIDGTYDGVTVTADGTDVTVVSTAKKVQYVLSGSCSDGSFKVYSDNKFVLQLNGLTLHNPSGPAINIQKGKTMESDGGYPHKSVFVLLTGTNTLSDGSNYSQSVTVDGTDEDQKACFFSEGQLIFSGSGTLNITGNNRHAVRSDDYIRLRNSVTINATAIGEDAINGNEYLIVDGGTYSLSVSAAKGKGFKADTILIAGGTTSITCTGSSAEGIEADYLTINDGQVECLAKDDGINAAKSIVINGGYIYTRGTNNDGLDSNGTITINGGVVVAVGTQTPEEGIDCDQNNFTITGGIILGIGGASSIPTSSTCTQPSLLYGGSCTANTRISLLDSEGNIVLTYVPEAALRQMTLLLSAPTMTQGSAYTLVSGGTYTASTSADALSFHNLTNAGTLSSPTTLTSATLSSVVTTVGNVSGGGGNPGGGPGGGGGRPGGH
ncbi:MAG TPA: hypothetical protein DIW30_08250 [Bacteroidales bacterium]|nr:hypothetical protein [Bacteroidales bacterium]